ncbi:MAG: DNA-binding domain-containing protein [Polyangiaceae bacterium]|jgi:hypothetical protein|nr:DNA-binding domain-containing protein [Polyangiaceae bacterium]
MSSLFEAQAAMKRALFGEDRSLALQHLGGDREAASERLAIYERMYLARLVTSMEDDFPALRRVAGDLFPRLAVTHVRRRPSRHASLARLGDSFDETLTELGLLAEAAVARVEQARNRAFWSPDRPPVNLGDLAALGAALGETSLKLHPSVQLFASLSGARAVVEGAPLRVVEPGSWEQVVSWRQGFEIHVDEVPPDEAQALDVLLCPSPLERALEFFASRQDPEGAAIEAVQRWALRGWLVFP